MPQQNFSNRIGSSTSKKINSVIKNSADGQRVLTPKSALAGAFNKKTVSVSK
jgi:hypothetical protein